MGKSKKKKNKDFQKVKLKVGRKLQKADNVTNASFHSRSIQIVQHIKAHGDEPSTKRNLNISVSIDILHINKFLEISPSTGFKARAVTGMILYLQQC